MAVITATSASAAETQAMPMFREFTMPLTPSSAVAGTRRRSFFAGVLGAVGVLGVTTGCAGGDGRGDDGATADEDSPAARGLRKSAARQRRELLARYDGTTAVHTGLEGRLNPLRASVAQHAEALGGADAARRVDADRSAVPEDERGALAALAAAEQQASDAHIEALTGAPPQLARLLASVAAAGATHAYLLGKDDA